MVEKLIIRDFGPIKNIEIELRKLNILIGEQATGKSTVAKVLCVCRYFSYIIPNNYNQLSIPDTPFSEGLNAWGLYGFLQPNSYIEYSCKHYRLIAKNEIKVEKEFDEDSGETKDFHTREFTAKLEDISEDFKKLRQDLEAVRIKVDNDYDPRIYEWRIPETFFQNQVKKVLDNPIYIPADRGLQSIFSLGKSSIQNISDALFNFFAKSDQIVRSFRIETFIDPIDVIYKNENGKGLFKRKGDDSFYNLSSGADGYKSTIPIVLLTKYYSERKRKKTLVIEEPEISLFPITQKKIVEFLVNQINDYEHQIFLTTHSPYVLTSLNNLIYAFEVGKKNDEVGKIVDKKYWINKDDVSAYILKYDKKLQGTIQEEILDSEGLLEAQKIDGVSAILNSDFDKLMNIELGIANENTN